MQNRKRDTDVQNRILESVGEGEGGMFQGNNIKTCIFSRVKQITSPGCMHETSARDISLATKVHIVKAAIFPVVMYRCESWIKKSECQGTDAFELWYWKRLLRIPWIARRSNQ